MDLAQPFARLSIPEAIQKYTDIGEKIADADELIVRLKKLGMSEAKDRLSSRSLPALQVLYFEEAVESALWQPTHHGAPN